MYIKYLYIFCSMLVILMGLMYLNISSRYQCYYYIGQALDEEEKEKGKICIENTSSKSLIHKKVINIIEKLMSWGIVFFIISFFINNTFLSSGML